MCGRFVQKGGEQYLAAQLQLSLPNVEMAASYNLAPTQSAVIALREKGATRLERVRWGLIPSWAKDATIGARLTNARSETLIEKPSFRSAFRKRRCLVAAEGFFEWRQDGAKKKTPIFIRMKTGEPFAMAGLWERWTPPGSPAGTAPLMTFTIVTTRANDLLRAVHERMPVILPREEWDRWLDDKMEDAESLLPLFEPYPADGMEWFEVSGAVNSPSNNHAGLIDRVASQGAAPVAVARAAAGRSAKGAAKEDEAQLDLFGAED